jgi:hypothetical protein
VHAGFSFHMRGAGHLLTDIEFSTFANSIFLKQQGIGG